MEDSNKPNEIVRFAAMLIISVAFIGYLFWKKNHGPNIYGAVGLFALYWGCVAWDVSTIRDHEARRVELFGAVFGFCGIVAAIFI